MPLSPLMNVPIIRQDTTIDVVSKGDGTHAVDEVVVTTTIDLAADIDPNEPVTVLLPMATDAQQKALLRWSEDDPATESVTFDPVERSAYDQAVADAVGDLQEEDRKEHEKAAKAIAKAAKSFSQAVLVVKPGQRRLRFFYVIAAKRADDGTYRADVLGPLSSFVLQAGGSLSVIALLARGTALVEAHAYTDPVNLTGELTTEQATVAGRHILGWSYTNDPLFRITYRY